MVDVHALILTGFGINCDAETAEAFNRAGAIAAKVHLNDLIEKPSRLDSYHILAVPGGFSFGDHVASGKILANRLRHQLGDAMAKFIRDGKLAIGICNGFQVMVKAGLLPLFDGEFTQEVTLTHNDSGRFEDRWVNLVNEAGSKCVWLKDIDQIEMPIRHGEGKFVVKDESVMQKLQDNGQIALRYATPGGTPAQGRFPMNPNGSILDIAGISDPSGRVFGLMPHPEAYLERTNHPQWTRLDLPEEGAGLKLFNNAVDYARQNLA